MDHETANLDSVAKALYRRGSDQLLSDSSVRDALDDEQAQQLLDWGLARLRAEAQELRHLPTEEAQARIDEKIQTLRRRMQQANRLIEQIPHEMDRQIVFAYVMERLIQDEEI
ncbi:MAG: hypothetical protein ACOC9E_03700 [Chloroflexota bacterium]